MTLCDHCSLADRECPIYPQETDDCSVFHVAEGQRDAAVLIIAAGLRACKAGDKSIPARWAVFVETIEGKRG